VGGSGDMSEIVKIMDMAKVASEEYAHEFNEKNDGDDNEDNPNAIDATYDDESSLSSSTAAKLKPPKLKPSDRKLADRIISVMIARDDEREWAELIKESEVWRASADNVFIRLKQRIAKASNKEVEWDLRVLERDLTKMHQMFLNQDGPFKPTSLSAAALKKAATEWAAGGLENMTPRDREMCDKLAIFFERRDPSEWFRILRESKTWPIIAERFFYRLRMRIRSERGEKKRESLIEMRAILRECHQQVFGVEAPDTASLEALGSADYRKIKTRSDKNVDSNTQYYWNKLIGGSKRERREKES